MSKDLKDIRKEQIMNAAQAVVVSKGYDQSRMDDIVAKAQLSKGEYTIFIGSCAFIRVSN